MRSSRPGEDTHAGEQAGGVDARDVLAGLVLVLILGDILDLGLSKPGGTVGQDLSVEGGVLRGGGDEVVLRAGLDVLGLRHGWCGGQGDGMKERERDGEVAKGGVWSNNTGCAAWWWIASEC